MTRKVGNHENQTSNGHKRDVGTHHDLGLYFLELGTRIGDNIHDNKEHQTSIYNYVF